MYKCNTIVDVYRTPILMMRILIRSPEYFGSYTTTVLSPGERGMQENIAPGYVPNRYATSRTKLVLPTRVKVTSSPRYYE